MDSKLEAHLKVEIPRLASVLARVKRQDREQDTGTLVSRDDLTQEMWLAAADREETLAKHLADGNETAIRTVLMSAGQRMIRAEVREQRTRKAAAAGYETYDEAFYPIGSLRRLLPMYLDALDDDGLIPERPPVGREQAGKVSGDSASYGDYLATMMDIHRAFVAISPAKQKILERYFSYPQGSGGWTHTEIASAMGMPPNELSPRIHHALSALQRELGGQNPWTRGPTPGRGQK